MRFDKHEVCHMILVLLVLLQCLLKRAEGDEDVEEMRNVAAMFFELAKRNMLDVVFTSVSQCARRA